jgi:hypothetical protein
MKMGDWWWLGGVGWTLQNVIPIELKWRNAKTGCYAGFKHIRKSMLPRKDSYMFELGLNNGKVHVTLAST